MTHRKGLALLLLLWSAGAPCCGAARQPAATALEAEPFVPAAFLLDQGNSRLDELQPPDGTAEELEADVATAEGEAARRARLDAAVAHLFEAEDSEDEAGRRRHLRAAARLAARAGRGAEDRPLAAAATFVELYCAWRQGERSSRSLLQRLLRSRDGVSPDLRRLAHAIAGEMALEDERWEDAISAFRELVGETGDPLYVYSRYRMAGCLEATGQERQARQALREVRDLGCDAAAAEPIQGLARVAASDLGTGLARAADGRVVPASCLPPGGR